MPSKKLVVFYLKTQSHPYRKKTAKKFLEGYFLNMLVFG